MERLANCYIKSTNLEVEPGHFWDQVTIDDPCVIRLVRNQADYRDGSFLVAFYFDPTISYFDSATGMLSYNQNGALRLLQPFFSIDGLDYAKFDVFYSTGRLHRVGDNLQAFFEFSTDQIFITNNFTDQYLPLANMSKTPFQC